MSACARLLAVVSTVCLGLGVAAGTAAASSVNYGDISHKNMKDLGQASTGTKLPLEVGMIANQSGIQNAVKSASNPTSSSYGKYVSISTIQSKYGASSSRRNAVTGAFKKYGASASVDVFHLRVVTTITIGTAQKMFGTKWHNYLNTSTNAKSALPVNTPKLPSGLSGNVDTIAGLNHVTNMGSGSAADLQPQAAYAGGTPKRTGTISAGCAPSSFPGAVFSSAGLFPNQILTTYGSDQLRAAGLQGQGINVAILGEAPANTNDVSTFRNCFGFQGTSLKNHNGSNIKPILESSLDAMTMAMAMVAPKLNRLDLWVKQLGQANAQGAIELLAMPIQATTNGTPLPNVISVSYGICEATAKPASAARTLFDRELAAIDALGITVAIAAGDSGSSACAHGVKPSQLTSYDKQKSASWPATSAYALAVGGTNLTLTPDNAIGSSGVWNDTAYPAPYNTAAGGGGGSSAWTKRPWWQPSTPSQSTYRMVPDVAAFADAAPGYTVVCSSGVQGCPSSSGQTLTYVGGTSASTPLVAGMIALWDQYAKQLKWPKPGFVPPLLYSIAKQAPTSFLDITTGTNSVFSNVSCCTAGPGYDQATGLGSPFANLIAGQLKR